MNVFGLCENINQGGVPKLSSYATARPTS